MRGRAAGIPTFFLELLYSHVLFFDRDPKSAKIGAELGIDMSLIREFHKFYSPVDSDLQLQNFPVYANRLQCIQLKMSEWRPQSISELAVRPYKDPLTFYAFWFATIVGFVGVFGLSIGIAQTYAPFKSLQLQIQQLK
jgi:hypothetical protein